MAGALADHRLRIPIVNRDPGNLRIFAIVPHFILHRSTLPQILANTSPDQTWLEPDPSGLLCSAPWGFDPIAVTDRHGASLAERRLFRSLRKIQDGWTSRWLNRYVSLFMSRFLVRTALTPNQISLAILVVGVAGAILATRGSYPALAIGAVLFQLQSVLDGCDGEISRITYRGSKTGEWLDTVGDDLTNYGFFAGAAWGLFQTHARLLYLIAGIVTVGCGVLSSGLEYRYLIKIGSGDLLKYPLSQATTSAKTGIARLAPLLKRDSFVFLTMLSALLNVIGIALVVFALGAIAITVAVLRTEYQLARSSPGER